jgi:4-diphosphocytidyl-2-C-methyl-D-erythritol kinase
VTSASAHAKLNLSLVVGPPRADGMHAVATVIQAIDLHDDVELEQAPELAVEGFEDDTLVRAALESIARRAGVAPDWRARIEKRIPVAAGLGGGSSDAAAALRLANGHLAEPLEPEVLHELAAGLGADVPFFLHEGAQLAIGTGTELQPLDLPTEYAVLVVLADGARKESTAAVYRSFEARRGFVGFDERRRELLDALEHVEEPVDLSRLPRNDLASSDLADELERLGAFRADVTGAGPAVYGLFEDEPAASRAASSLRRVGPTWLAQPVAGGSPPGG